MVVAALDDPGRGADDLWRPGDVHVPGDAVQSDRLPHGDHGVVFERTALDAVADGHAAQRVGPGQSDRHALPHPAVDDRHPLALRRRFRRSVPVSFVSNYNLTLLNLT